MNAIIDAAISRTRTVLSIFVITIFWGIISYVNIPKENEPDIPFPFIVVSIPHPGISPVDAERLLLKPMEKRLQTIEGLKTLSAKALEGQGYLALEFDVDFEVDQALVDVREQVDIARADLPDDTEEPIVMERNAALFPILAVMLSGDAPERKLDELARKLKDRIESIPTVLNADLAGNREELLEVVINPAKMEAYNVSQQELLNAVTQNNRLIAAGNLDTGAGRFSVKVPGLIETAQDVYEMVIKSSGDGVVTLGDLAEIRRTFKDPETYARSNGSPAIAIQVVKRTGSNIILTNKAVREVVDYEKQFWPEGVTVTYTLDKSVIIRDSINELQANILTAISLVMIIVVAALGIRSGLMVGLSIPSSFLLCFMVLSWTGTTINQMVMFGLVLAVGMLVDGSIVVIEYADRKMAEGQHRKTAYGMAAKRMFWPIVTSTATTLAAFIPMMLWPGIMGKFMGYLPYTLIIILTCSLFVALIFLPVIGSVIGRQQEEQDDEALKALAMGETGSLDDLKGYVGDYVRLVTRAVHNPLRTLGFAIASVIAILFLFSNTNVKTNLFIDGDTEVFAVIVAAKGNLSIQEQYEFVSEVEDKISQVEGIRDVYSTIGGADGIAAGPETPPPDDMIGRINVELSNWKTRPKGDAIVEEVRQLLRNYPGLRIEVRAEEDGPPVGKDIQVELSSNFGDILLEEASRVADYLEGVKGVIELEDSRPQPGIEWELLVDREQAGRFGADITQIGVMVQLVTNGVLLGEYRPDDAEEEVEIRVRFPKEERSIDKIDTLRVQTNEGLIPISNFVTREARPQVDKIDRRDSERVIFVRANVDPALSSTEKVNEVKEFVSKMGIDPRVSYKFRGADEEGDQSTEFLQGAMFLSLFLMAMILLTQFNSFYHVVLTLSSVIFATIGVLLGIVITGQSFSIVMTGVGILALAGIVVNNNIVLIDTFHRINDGSYSIYEAAVRTAAQRLRPVLLTTVTTICGLMPMAMKVSLDYFSRDFSMGSPMSLWWVELATAVIFGLAFSTLITLVLTPSLLVLPHYLRETNTWCQLKAKVNKWRGKVPTQPAE